MDADRTLSVVADLYLVESADADLGPGVPIGWDTPKL
jgi:hypothetical protein